MEQEIKKWNIQEAIDLIKKGFILLCIQGKKKTFCVHKKEKVYIQNDSVSYYLSFEEFLSLFSQNKFIIYEAPTGGQIDLQKDAEYYSYDVLKY